MVSDTPAVGAIRVSSLAPRRSVGLYWATGLSGPGYARLLSEILDILPRVRPGPILVFLTRRGHPPRSPAAAHACQRLLEPVVASSHYVARIARIDTAATSVNLRTRFQPAL